MFKFLTTLSLFVLSHNCLAENPPRFTLFPIEKYSQNPNDYFLNHKPNKRLVSRQFQAAKYHEYLQHYFLLEKDSQSPWSKSQLVRLISLKEKILKYQQYLIKKRDNQGKPNHQIGYGMNYRPHTKAWIKRIEKNMQISKLSKLQYHIRNRAITVTNLYLRELPTDDPFFFHYSIPGQGYPFDKLQISAVLPATPVYVLHTTKDKAWSLVITPDLIGWIHSDSIAYTSELFINQWVKQAQQNLAGIKHSDVSISSENGAYQFTAQVGTQFPVVETTEDYFRVLIPHRSDTGKASVNFAKVYKDSAGSLPLSFTYYNAANLLSQLINRTYGSGGLNFYNDCSLELKRFYSLFGIYLPRHSANQLQFGKSTNLMGYSARERIQYLKEHAKPLLTLIYLKNHIMIYIGNHTLFWNNKRKVPFVYHNTWSMKHRNHITRAAIGQSFIIPLLEQYTENKDILTRINEETFIISDIGAKIKSSKKNRYIFEQLR